MKTFHECITKLKQFYVNNGYSDECFDKTLQEYFSIITKFIRSYKTDECIMKDLVYNNIKCTKKTGKLKLIDIKEQPITAFPFSEPINLIYVYKCNIHECKCQIS